MKKKKDKEKGGLGDSAPQSEVEETSKKSKDDSGFKVPRKKSGSKKKKLKKSESKNEVTLERWTSFATLDKAATALGLTNDSPDINNRRFGACFMGKECVDWILSLKEEEVFCASRQEANSLATQLLENKYMVQLSDTTCQTFDEERLYWYVVYHCGHNCFHDA